MICRPLVLPALLACVVLGSPAQAQPAPAPATAAQPEARKLLGQLKDGIYRAPSGAYAVPAPILHGEAATIMDTDTVVVFKDKLSVLLTIAAFPMPAYARWEYQTQTPRDYLITFFHDNILRDYRAEFPESLAESVKFLPDYNGGTLLAYALMPGGSAFALDPAVTVPPGQARGTAKRGHLIFVKNDHVFILAIELAERVTKQSQYNLSTAEEDRILLDRLATVITAMQIPAAPPPAPAP